MRRFSLFLLVGLIVAYSLQATGTAETGVPQEAKAYPSQPITVVLPMSPGGSHDIHARGITSVLSDILGVPVVMRFNAGGGGIRGTEEVARAVPDGYTIIFSSNGNDMIVPQTMEVTYDTLRDFKTIARINMSQPILVARADAPYNTVAEFVAHARRNPDAINHGVIGLWGATYMTTVQLVQAADLKLNLIPHRGGGEAMQALLASGQDQLTWMYASAVRPHLEAGTVKVLAVAGDQRITGDPLFADVPTMVEAGFPAVDFTLERVFFAPAGIPADRLARLRGAFEEMLDHPSFKAYMQTIGEPVHFVSGEEYDALRPGKYAAYRELIQKVKKD